MENFAGQLIDHEHGSNLACGRSLIRSEHLTRVHLGLAHSCAVPCGLWTHGVGMVESVPFLSLLSVDVGFDIGVALHEFAVLSISLLQQIVHHSLHLFLHAKHVLALELHQCSSLNISFTLDFSHKSFILFLLKLICPLLNVMRVSILLLLGESGLDFPLVEKFSRLPVARGEQLFFKVFGILNDVVGLGLVTLGHVLLVTLLLFKEALVPVRFEFLEHVGVRTFAFLPLLFVCKNHFFVVTSEKFLFEIGNFNSCSFSLIKKT